MKWSFQIGSIRGIPIKLHVTFLIIFLFVIWFFATQAQPIYNITIGFGEMNISSGLKFLLGTIAAVLFLQRFSFTSSVIPSWRSGMARIYGA